MSARTVAFSMLTAIALTAQPPPDPIIEAARTAAVDFRQSLPDYIVKRTTTRYRGRRDVRLAGESIGHWQAIDAVSGIESYEHGREVYSNITINGNPAQSLPARGAWSAGEFSTTLVDVLGPDSAAVFSHKRHASLTKYPCWRYDFAIDKAHSTWRLIAEDIPGVPGTAAWVTAYAGEVWIDRASGKVLRIRMSARNTPSSFPLNSVESTVDYDFVKIAEQEYLLPIHSESLTCVRNSAICLRNETVFEHYDKFGSDTSIAFDDTSK